MLKGIIINQDADSFIGWCNEELGTEEKNDYTLEDMVCYDIPAEAHGEFLRPDVCSTVDMTVSYMEIKVEV